VFIFFLQLRDTLHGGRLYVFSILVALTWVLWAIKLRLSRRYAPWVGEHVTTASVVIPVVDAGRVDGVITRADFFARLADRFLDANG